MKSLWKPLNRRLRNQIPDAGWNDRDRRYYWISGMNQNHSNFFCGGFYYSLSHAASQEYGGDYVVDMEAKLIARSADIRATLADMEAAFAARQAA